MFYIFLKSFNHVENIILCCEFTYSALAYIFARIVPWIYIHYSLRMFVLVVVQYAAGVLKESRFLCPEKASKQPFCLPLIDKRVRGKLSTEALKEGWTNFTKKYRVFYLNMIIKFSFTYVLISS